MDYLRSGDEFKHLCHICPDSLDSDPAAHICGHVNSMHPDIYNDINNAALKLMNAPQKCAGKMCSELRKSPLGLSMDLKRADQSALF